MKTSPLSRAVLAALFLSAAGAQATVTLTFSSFISGLATNWGNSDDAGGEQMTWGVIIDTAGNGFSVNYLPSSIDFGLTGTAQSLSNPGGVLTDDVLFLSLNNPMQIVAGSPPDGAVAGMNRISAVSSLPVGVQGVTPGDPFMIVWFDRTQGGAVTPAGAPVAGDRFGVFAAGIFVMPEEGETRFYTEPFVGPDPLKLMNRSFVPEPSAALLSLLGAAGLVRRRR